MENKIINAAPTKDFFIHMLTRDVLLSRAIIDLVDNSIDGAKRMRPDGSFYGLRVALHISENEFRIEDNCGGIPIDTARDYAFRFGRPKGAPKTAGSVGQFGVGMKRTFFKLGRFFQVDSITSTSRFQMKVDVDEWLAEDVETDAWHFDFKSVSEGEVNPIESTGTQIVVNRLLDEASRAFSLQSFIKELELGLSEGHALVLEAGLQISLNGVFLSHHPLEILQSTELHPAYSELEYYPSEPEPVKVRIYAGLSRRQKDDGGWYIFCNGRLVVRADQSVLSGWGEDGEASLPKYHPDFAFFRGYVFFNSDDASKLPWTTTKTGVDADSWLYSTVRAEMIQISRPVLKFLRDLAAERADVASGDKAFSSLERVIQRSAICALSKITSQGLFSAPSPEPVTGPRMQKIQYSKPAEEVDRVKAALGVRNFTEVGIRTFDYFCEYELQENG